MRASIIDTDILSCLLRQDPRAIAGATAYLDRHSFLSISIITRYEILRGLMAKDADKQALAFEAMCESMIVVPISDAIVRRAAEIYARLRKQGQLIGDADILIAATCLDHEYDIVTNNTSHFERIAELALHNWIAN